MEENKKIIFQLLDAADEFRFKAFLSRIFGLVIFAASIVPIHYGYRNVVFTLMLFSVVCFLNAARCHAKENAALDKLTVELRVLLEPVNIKTE